MNALIELPDGTEISVTPHPDHIWTQTTEQVAQGYDVKPQTITKHLREHSDELIEGEHFYRETSRTTNSNSRNLKTQSILWTKLGVATVGFFIRSKRAKMYRRAAAELVIDVNENKFAVVTTDNPELDALQGLINMMRKQDAEQKIQCEEIRLLKLKEEERSGKLEWITCAGYLNMKGEKADRKTCAQLGKLATKEMKNMNLERGTMPDPRFGEVGTYHPDALDKAWAWMELKMEATK